jgi:hypothetical protein
MAGTGFDRHRVWRRLGTGELTKCTTGGGAMRYASLCRLAPPVNLRRRRSAGAMQTVFESFWARTRQARIGFIAGLIVGVLAGWFFHGLISFIIRFFFVLVLLIPFVVAVVAWWRLRRQVRHPRDPRDEPDDWPPRPVRPVARRRPDESMDGDVITVDSLDAWERPLRPVTRERSPEE